MSDDKHPQDDSKQAQPPKPDTGSTQRPINRKSLPTDPTMPIKLDRSMWKDKKPNPLINNDNTPMQNQSVLPGATAELPPNAPTPPPVAPIKIMSLDDGDDQWLGKEQTMVGGAPPIAKAAPAPAEQWLGNEQTMVGPAAKAAEPKEEWLGQEQTMVGAPVPKMTPPGGGGSDEEWIGREATMLGIAPKGGDLSIKTPGERKKEGTTGTGSRTGSGTRGTSPAMDDGWHLKGRQGNLTGKQLGDYEIGGILGEGGMGTVYRARQISLKRRVALKVLPSHLTADPSMRARFEQEARTASLLNTPHVVQVFAAGAQDDIVYFVMEYVEGVDLAGIINEKKDRGEKMTVEEAAGYVLQAARGLAEAAKHNIVHRDIKPPNMMITAKGVLKIADFGISKIAGETGMTMTGTAVGTPAYCSPEQGRGDMVDCRADLYSLGVVFFELLTGQKPFDGTTANALIYQHNYAEPPLPTSIDPTISEQYQAVVMKCLQKDPAKRYQDAAEMVTDLERIRDGSMSLTAVFSSKFGTGAEEAMSRYLGVRKRKIWPLVAAGLVLMGGGGGGFWYWQQQAEVRGVERKDVERLMANLKVLDEVRDVPKGAVSDLEALRKYKGSADANVVRWTAKLNQVGALQKRLAHLDEVDVVDAALRVEAEKALISYKDHVGDKGVDTMRWSAKLDSARSESTDLRRSLKDIDDAAVITTAIYDRLDPQLKRFESLVGDKDPDAARWRQKFSGYTERVVQLRAELAVLDDANAAITEGQASRLRSDLVTLTQLLSGGDKDSDRWTSRIDGALSYIKQLRTSVSRLDNHDEYVTLALQNALKADLATLKTLVDANDPDLKHWLRRVEESTAYIKDLRGRLARLDDAKPVSITEMSTMGDTLDHLRALVTDDDNEVQGWQRRMRSSKGLIDGLRETLTRLDAKDPVKLEDQRSCAVALKQLDDLGGLKDEQKRGYQRRLDEEQAKVDELRTSLRAKAARNVRVNKALVDEISTLGFYVGEQDPDVHSWRGKIADYTRLHLALKPLDEAAALPVGVDALLEEFARIVGDGDDEITVWRDKVALVGKLRTDLAVLDTVAPVPSRASAEIALLASKVGAAEPDVKRWDAKVLRVGALKGALTERLANAYVLPIDAPKLSSELLSLVGSAEEDVKTWATRVAILQGPPAPAWATATGSDQYGPWADLTVKGITQRFRYVPSGQFTMGTTDHEKGRDKDEVRVSVTLTRSYWMADSECTQGFYEAIGAKHDSKFRGTERPVDRISWEDCGRFMLTLNSAFPKLQARLPTEAEWEYACRGGNDVPFSSYQGPLEEAKLETVAWFTKNAPSGSKDVKRRFPNVLGLHDMHGNLWEWCQDNYGNYSPTPIADPLGREEENHVARGGSWGDQASKLRAGNRLSVRGDMRTVYVGFRLAAPVAWPEARDPVKDRDAVISAALATAGAPSVPIELPAA
ncbi:MAG: protein kinase, partial [Planctomycetes bacterium]|nr:protein kinase [Planctomycetota bacterium]